MPGQPPAKQQALYRVAYGSVPKDSGTFTFYRNLRPALREYGIELLCVTIGRQQANLVQAEFIDEGCVTLAPDVTSVQQQARAFAAWCEAESINIVMAINSPAILSALPHLPEKIRVVARCANAFEEGYQVTMSGRERLARIVALTPRLQEDLVGAYAVDPTDIALIPNGINPARYDELLVSKAPRDPAAPLQLGFLGRLEHRQKGVLHLPTIVDSLQEQGIPFQLRIAGKGRHEQELKKRLQKAIDTGCVRFTGQLSAQEVPEFLSSLDVFLFTSHFEGCPNALLEAMMAGVAPVAFQIDGIIDFILENGHSGLISPAGDCRDFAAQLASLASDSDRCIALGEAAALAARQRFTPAIAAAAYAEMFRDVMTKAPPTFTPRPWSEFTIDPTFDPGWKGLLPQAVKTLAKRFVRR